MALPDWSHVKSKVAQQFEANANHKAGGGDIKIIDEKLDWNGQSKIRDEWDGEFVLETKVLQYFFSISMQNWYLHFFFSEANFSFSLKVKIIRC